MDAKYLAKGETVVFKALTKMRPEVESGMLVITKKDPTLHLYWVKSGVGEGKPMWSMSASEAKSLQVSRQSTGKQALLKIGKEIDPASGTVFEFVTASLADPTLNWKERDKARELIAKFSHIGNTTAPSKAPATPVGSNATTAQIKTSPNGNVSANAMQTTPNNKPTTSEISPNGKDGQQSILSVSSISPNAALNSKQSAVSREQQQRAQLLASSKELRTLHEQLVKSGVISDAEFWESRKTMIQNELNKSSNQTTGMPTQLLSDVRPTMSTSATVHYKITPSIIHQIFLETPAVERLYRENVPDKMSETQFWTKYFESLHFHRDKRSNASTISTTPSSEDDLFSRVAEEQEKEDAEPVLYRKKVKNIDSAVDVSQNDEEWTDGHGIRKDLTQQPSRLAKTLAVIRRFNRHGQLVLEGPSLKKVKTEITDKYERIKNPDLVEESHFEVVPLNIENTSVYFDSRSQTGAKNGSSEDTSLLYKAFQNEVSNWTSNIKRALMSPVVAGSVVNELSALSKHTTTTMKENATEEELNWPQDFKIQLYSFFSTANELLRHFWGCFPITSPQLETKEKRIIGTISSLYDKINAFKKNIPPDKKLQWDALLLPIIQTLDKAVEKDAARNRK